MTVSQEHRERALRHLEGTEPRPDLYRTLLITSGWLTALAKQFDFDESTRAIIRKQDGVVVAEISLGEALDMADAALEPQESS